MIVFFHRVIISSTMAEINDTVNNVITSSNTCDLNKTKCHNILHNTTEESFFDNGKAFFSGNFSWSLRRIQIEELSKPNITWL